MKKLLTISIIAIAIIGFSGTAQADQFQTVMQAFDRYNRSLMTGTQYQPIQQYQQSSVQQPTQQPSTIQTTVQNVAGMANDVAYGIQTVKSITNMFKGGF